MRLIDADELLKKYSIYKGKRIPEKDINNFPITVNISEVKNTIRKAPTIHSGWKKAENKLPVQSGWYLALIDGRAAQAWFDTRYNVWTHLPSSKFDSVAVSYWMHFPAPPPKEG